MTQKRTSPTETTAAALPSTGVLLAVALALGVYLVAFYLWPISGRTGTDFVLRRGHVFVSLFLGDETVASWFSSVAWHSLGQRIEIICYAAVIFAAAVAMGWLALSAVRLPDSLTRLETFVYSAGVGLSVVSLATLLLGLAGAMQPGVFIGIGVIAIIIAAAVRVRQTQYPSFFIPEGYVVHGKLPSGTDGNVLTIDTRWLWLAVPFVVAILLGAMLPPVEFDVREYHLQAPKEFYQNGRITFLPHNVYANMPLGAEMLSLAAMIVTGDWWLGALVGKTLIASFAQLTALLLFAAGKRFASPSVGTIAALVYISIPWMALVAMQGLVDGVVAFYLVAAFCVTLLWRDFLCRGTNSVSLAALAGFLSGSAISVKYPAVVFSFVPLVILIAYESWRILLSRHPLNLRSWIWQPRPIEPDTRRCAVAHVIFACLALAACGPWLVKNAVLTGNPTYPLLYDWFDGATRTDARNRQWVRAHSPPNYELRDLARRAAGVAFTSDWLSPLVMPLAALSLLRWRRKPLVRTLAIYFVYVFICWWLFTHRIDRFWIPALPLAALAAGIGATWTAAHPWRLTLAGFMGLGLLTNFGVITSGMLGDNRFLADLDSLRIEAESLDPWHRYLNEHVAEVKRVLLIGDAQPFDLKVPVLYNTVFDESIFEDLARDRTPEQIRQALLERGISHLYIAWGEVGRYRSPGNYGFTKFIEPALFQLLVDARVLEELPAIKDNPGQMFRVRPAR